MSLGKLAKLLKENKLSGTHSSIATRHYLNTGYPPLNEIVSGDHRKGLPSGQVVMIAGPSACGKTMISTQLMISAQKQEGFAAFFDYETQYQMALALKQGLDPDAEKFAYYKPDTFEEGITDAIKLGKLIRENKIIPDDAPIVFVFDSLHAMTPKSKYDSLFAKDGAVAKGKKTSMHDNYALAKALADWSASIQREFDKFGATAIFLNQVRIETDDYGNEHYKFPGGDTLYFYCSTVLVLKAKNEFEGKGDDKVLVKKDIKALTDKSRNTQPFQNVHWDFKFNDDGSGNFDVATSYTNYLLDIGAIEIRGPWCYFLGTKVMGREKCVEHFRTIPDALEQLLKIHDEFKSKSTSKVETVLDEDA
jgi:RecA/RadA recombinase